MLAPAATNAHSNAPRVGKRRKGSLPSPQQGRRDSGMAHDRAPAAWLSTPPFLESVVQPLYDFLAHESFQNRDRDVASRVMYDDLNEFFWDADRLRTLLPSLCQGSVSTYAELRNVLKRATSAEAESMVPKAPACK